MKETTTIIETPVMSLEEQKKLLQILEEKKQKLDTRLGVLNVRRETDIRQWELCSNDLKTEFKTDNLDEIENIIYQKQKNNIQILLDAQEKMKTIEDQVDEIECALEKQSSQD